MELISGRMHRGRAIARMLAASILFFGLTSCTADTSAIGSTASRIPDDSVLGLPTIPWEGGPAYWKAFAKADRAGWSEPSFFPIVAWYDSASNDREVEFDKNLGINTYLGMPDTLDAALLDSNGMYWIGGALNETFNGATPSWVGYFLDDEVDGRFSPEDGRRHLAERKASAPEGLFSYANFTYMVLENDLDARASSDYVNSYTDAVSVDKYWYTIPHCSAVPYRDVSLIPIPQASCRTSSSYGQTIKALRQRDAEDGHLQPLWQFVENLGGTDQPQNFSGYIQPAQIEGAVMSSIINEARGLVYFNQSFSGPCQSSNVFRSAQVVPGFCGREQVEAVKRVNKRIHRLAPVINTQSLQWDFGDGASTMLKVDAGYAYLFAMTDGQGRPGLRHFQWPASVTGRTAEVLFESRSVALDADGQMSDQFPSESTYHIYKVKI